MSALPSASPSSSVLALPKAFSLSSIPSTPLAISSLVCFGGLALVAKRRRSSRALPTRALQTMATTPAVPPVEKVAAKRIPSHVNEMTTHSNYREIRAVHANLDLNVSFEKKQIVGSVTLDCERISSTAKELVLDTSSGLSVTGAFVYSDSKWAKCSVVMGEEHPVKGRAVRVDIASASSAAPLRVKVEFATSKDASALQWLTAEQTAGKRHPFLFTQSQAIHARSFFPIQDAPCVKFTYEASVVVNGYTDEITPLMSAASLPTRGSNGEFKFIQNIPVPAYLVALAAGRLESRDLSHRCRVWAEPETVEASAYEFEHVEKFLTQAETLCGPYPWGRYDMLVLPPSFPYGGMENPMLTFLTPTLLAGDRSLVDVVVHEIMHSWFGNNVTNATWEDFWLNEGCTVFSEQRVILGLYGKERASMKMAIGRKALEESVKQNASTPAFTKLHIENPKGDIDPDDSFSSVPYEKGCAFLQELEKQAGGPAVFEPYLREYIRTFQFDVVDAASFQALYTKKFPEAAKRVDWQIWLHGTGLPPNFEEQGKLNESELIREATSTADKWAVEGLQPKSNKAWPSDQTVVFLERLLELNDSGWMNNGKRFPLEALDEAFGFSRTNNAELRFRWISLRLRRLGASHCGTQEDEDRAIEDAVAFLNNQGRMKFVRPTFRSLANSGPKGKQAALKLFETRKASLHAICAKMVERDLNSL